MQERQVPVNIVGSSIFGRYNKISSEKTVNMFISDDWLVSFDGWKRVADIIPATLEGSGRGFFTSIRNNIAVAVVNSSVYVISSALMITFVGDISTSEGDVFMDENLNNQICIVDGLNMYIYSFDLNIITKQVLEVNLIPNYVTYHNTFFLIGNADTTSNGAAWYAFSYESPTTVTDTTQLALQTKPDYAIAIERMPGGGNNVIVFGTSVAEIWTQIGGLNNYERNKSINVDYGCLSVSTIAASDKYVIWLGINESNSPAIMIFTNNGSMRISTDGIDYQLSTLQYPEQSTAFFYRTGGHLFYQISFYNPVDNLSLLYDVDLKKFYHITDHQQNYHPANRVIYFNNNTYFVSLNNGSMYQMGTQFTTYNENIETDDEHLDKEIPRIRICKSIRAPDSRPFRARNIVIPIDQGNDPNITGLSLIAGLNYLVTEEPNSDFIVTETGQRIIAQGPTGFSASSVSMRYNPRVDLSISKDGGVTFGSYLQNRLNPLGKRKNMLSFQRQLGYCNDLTPKFHFWGTSYFCAADGVVTIY